MNDATCAPADCACRGEHAEVHIAGVLIHARPGSLADVCRAVSMLPKAEVTHEAGDGRAVAVLEAATGRAVLEQLEAIRTLPGVLNAALVYQHAEAAEDLDKEMQA